MPALKTYLAVFYSDKSGPKWQAWNALTEEERTARDAIGIPALDAWDEAHKDQIVHMGGPLGRTLRVTEDGTTPAVNELTAFVVVRAPSLEEAAKLFEGHPHLSIFPCHAVDIMPILIESNDFENG